MGNYRSAFNLRGCQNFGGSASGGSGSCGLNVSTDQINVNWVSQNELTQQELVNLKDYLTTDIVPLAPIISSTTITFLFPVLATPLSV